MAIGTVWGDGTWGDDAWGDCWGNAVDAVVASPAGGYNPFTAFLRQAIPRRPPLDLDHRGAGGLVYSGSGTVTFDPAPVTQTAFAGSGGLEVIDSAATVAVDNQVRVEARRAARRAAIIMG